MSTPGEDEDWRLCKGDRDAEAPRTKILASREEECIVNVHRKFKYKVLAVWDSGTVRTERSIVLN